LICHMSPCLSWVGIPIIPDDPWDFPRSMRR
jgi:hypothetical protein